MKDQSKSIIIKMLADGKFVSGEHLGAELSISRTAVARHIKQLTELGLDIYSVRGKGYKLANSLSMLDQQTITNNLETPVPVACELILPSTNDVMMQKIRNGTAQHGEVLIAECQTAGKGRRGRVWQSPIGSHIYFSQYYTLSDGLIAASGLSLAVGLAVARTCQKFTEQKVSLKWPNDVLVNKQKLAGILVEAEGQSEGKCHVVVGIGINIDMPDTQAEKIDQPWIDLTRLSTQPVDRNLVISELLNQLSNVMSEYQQNRLNNLHQDWNELNAFAEQQVVISSVNQKQYGVCRGIDESGALILLEQSSGSEIKIFGGELSLRAAL